MVTKGAQRGQLAGLVRYVREGHARGVFRTVEYMTTRPAEDVARDLVELGATEAERMGIVVRSPDAPVTVQREDLGARQAAVAAERLSKALTPELLDKQRAIVLMHGAAYIEVGRDGLPVDVLTPDEWRRRVSPPPRGGR